MATERPTPCVVMFEALKDFGGLSYKDLAGIILSDRPVYEGKSPRSRIDDKTWVSRYLVHAPVGSLPESCFADFGTSARAVAARLKSSGGAGKGNAEIAAFLCGKAGEGMRRALDECGRDGAIYLNVQRRISSMSDASPADVVDLLLLHFLAAGCLNDARKAADSTLGYAQSVLGVGFKTMLPTVVDRQDDRGDQGNEEVYLCLFRIKDGRIKGAPYYLNPGEEGTEIGSLSTARYSINDVEDTVSSRHARIWRERDGRWFIEGLGSKNGTVVVSGADRREVLVEPPRSERAGFVSCPVEISPSDELVLGRDTVFMVMEGVAD